MTAFWSSINVSDCFAMPDHRKTIKQLKIFVLTMITFLEYLKNTQNYLLKTPKITENEWKLLIIY